MGERLAAPVAALVATGATAVVLLRGRLGSLGPNLVLLTIAYAALAVVLAVEVRRSRAGRAPSIGIALTGVCTAGLLVLAVVQPPTQSNDVWAYAWYGRVVAHYHGSPYRHPAASKPDDKWAQRVDRVWQKTDSVYGPVFTAVSAAGMAVFGFSFLTARLFFQILAALCVLACIVIVWKRTRSPAAVAMLGLNPLVVISVVNGAHNDAWVGLAIVGGVVLVIRDRMALAGLAFAAAALIKIAAGLPLLAVGLWVLVNRGWRPAAVLGGAAAGAGVASYALAGGVAAVEPLQTAQTHFSGASVWFGPRRWLGAHGATRQLAAAATAAVVALTLLLSSRRLNHSDPAIVAGAAVVAYVLIGFYVLPWYVFWGLPALLIAWRSKLTWLALLHGAVLHLVYVPDPLMRGRALGRHVWTPLQNFQLDLFHVWVPLVELVIVAAVVINSVRPRRREATVRPR